MPAIAVHHTSTTDTAWDGPAAKANLKLDQSRDYYAKAFAWRDPEGDESNKGTYKFIHHEVTASGDVGAANTIACSAAIAVLNGARGGSNIPDADRKAVHAHLAAHLKDAGKDVPELKAVPMTGKQHLRMEIKDISETGAFDGILSTYGNIDLGGDMVMPGAFAKSIKDRGTEIPLLWQHQSDNPIGTLVLQDGPDALRVKGQLLMELPEARKAYLLAKARIVKGLSIGFETVKDAIEDGVRKLKEIKLYEGSMVTFPMNESAVITAVKALQMEHKDMDEACEALCRMCRDMCESSLWYSWQSEDEIPDDDRISRLLADCWQACDFCAGAICRDSEMCAEICGLCESVCRKCAEACTASGDPVLAACGGACTACADCCAQMQQMAQSKQSQQQLETMRATPFDRKQQRKSGRMISAANQAAISGIVKGVRGHMEGVQGHMDDLQALVNGGEDGAGEKSTRPSAPSGAAGSSTEPVLDHSAAETLIDGIRSLFPQA